MTRNYLLLCLFGISTCFVARSDAIVAGYRVLTGTFEYQVSLKIKNEHQCGGCIIGEKYVLTAAHCVIDNGHNRFYPYNVTIAAGITNLYDKPIQTTVAETIFVPKEYKAPTINSSGDIAVIKVKHSLRQFERLEIPSKYARFSDELAVISGFGWNWVDLRIVNDRLEPYGNNTNGQLRSAKAVVLSAEDGEYSWSTNEGRRVRYPLRHIYAEMLRRRDMINAKTPYGVCFGDGGGPLVHKNQVIGVLRISNILCNESLLPAVYTRVSSYLEFIRNAMANRHLQTMHVHLIKYS